MSVAVQIDAGTVIAARYRVESSIGEGGFGGVYRAVNVETGQVVALKLLPARHTPRETEVKRFQREAALVTRLDHPNIVKTLDYGHTGDGVPFIAFELLEGVSLREKLIAEGALSVSRAGRIVVQVLNGLEHAHGLMIVHRDIKPANIFLCAGRDSDFVRVLDFGVAKALTPDNTNLTKLTSTGQFIGTPAYMSPEQVRGGDITPSSDLYSLGPVLSELVTGKKVAQGDSEIDVLMTHMSAGPLPLTEAVLESPFAEVIRRATEKEPSARYESAGEMRAAIEAVLAQRGAVSSTGPARIAPATPAPAVAPDVPAPAADTVAAGLRRATTALADPPPSALFDHVYAEAHPLVDAEREEHRAYLGSLEGASS